MKKILIVDDEENIRKLYAEEFQDMGYGVTAVPDGPQALSALASEKFDLVVLDMRMQEMGGIETLRQIKEQDKALPVVISSAYDEYKQDFATWASEAYIVKSADTSALREAVKKILG